jgi:hypothetical protein
MTIKYNVSGAKARNGKEIAPMSFGDRAEAERFAKYHEGLSVPQNLRRRPGTVQAFSNDRKDFEPTAKQTEAAEKFFARSAESLALHHQEIGRLTRVQDIVNITAQPLDNESDADKYAACEDAVKMNDNMRKYGTIDIPQSATVGNPNADLETAYEMGFLAATQRFTPFTSVDYTESQDYADQRRSDLKELVSYDRSI